jgi:enoyl-CoA hydratase
MQSVLYEAQDEVVVISINRPQVRNAVDGPTAAELAEAFRRFDADDSLVAAVFTGTDGTFSAGADLKAVAEGRGNRVASDGDGPMGPTRMLLTKPVIAAVEGHAVAGGLELAIWCDLRVAATDAVFGVYCRRWGVPLVDGGTVRLPRLIGHGRALDMILTGRPVAAEEAFRIGLVDRLAPPGQTREHAVELARSLARFPQLCLRSDRLSAYEQWDRPREQALVDETRRGLEVIGSGETARGALRFAQGKGRHGRFD